jgi:hypothetical protein
MQLLVKYVEEKMKLSKANSESIHRICKVQLFEIEKITLRPLQMKNNNRNSINLDGSFGLTHLKSLSMKCFLLLRL